MFVVLNALDGGSSDGTHLGLRDRGSSGEERVQLRVCQWVLTNFIKKLTDILFKVYCVCGRF